MAQGRVSPSAVVEALDILEDCGHGRLFEERAQLRNRMSSLLRLDEPKGTHLMSRLPLRRRLCRFFQDLLLFTEDPVLFAESP